MVETATKLPIKTETKAAAPAQATAPWHPFEDLRREVDRLFEDFGHGSWFRPLRSIEPMFQRAVWGTPAVDIVENDAGFEIAAELPGMDASNVELTLRNGTYGVVGHRSTRLVFRRCHIHNVEYGLTWTNNDSFSHTVRMLDSDDVQLMRPGESVTHTFPAPGLYRYDCSLHPQDMQGSVLVEAAPA